MIVSYSRNFIFIKTKKTAGTTVEGVLAAGCAPGDIVTYTASEGSSLDFDRVATPNFGFESDARTSESRRGSRRLAKELKTRARKEGRFFNHMTAEQAHAQIDPDFWKSAHKLTVERHPYEKAISQAFYRLAKHKNEGADVSDFIDNVVRKGDYPGFPRWSIDGEVAMDEFIRQETLYADLVRVGERLGISVPAELPQMKSKSRVDRRPAREILTGEQKQIVYERCQREFEILGYER